MRLEIVYLPVDELTPYKGNARRHGEEDVESIVRSIEEFDFDDPIGIWGKDNLIVEGHGRLMAAKKLGLEEVPRIRLDHLSEKQRKAYALAHNKTAELSTWDFVQLEQELSELQIEGVDMNDFGFGTPTDGSYVDDFFERGVEAKEKAVTLGVKVICGTQEQVEECMTMLKEAGYNPEEL